MENKEAMKILKDFRDKSALFSVRTALDTIIPELKESEDERIRKALIEYFNEQCDMSDWNGVYGYQVVAWLERQGGQKETLCDKCRKRTALVRCALEKQGEQKPAWSEEDERNLNDAILFIETGTYSLDKDNLINWLKSLKERVGCEVNCTTTKEWSEEDEEILNLIIARLHSHHHVDAEEYSKDYHWFNSIKDRIQSRREWSEEDEKHYQGCLNLMKLSLDTKPYPYYNDYLWLKSLKERYTWKPSDEQMLALDRAQAELCSTEYNKPICDLIDSLNKLREN